MKRFIIQEKFVGYADVTIEAETEEEALSLYNRGHYPDSDYVNNLTPDQLREIVHEQAHIDFENTRKDFGQIGVWEEMEGWDSELFESISKEFNLEEAE